jgi:sugar phosphate isomerase/epimerase
MSAMKLSIRENMVPGADLLERFRNLSRLGFDGIELTTSSRLEHAEEIEAAMRETGVQPSITSAGGGCLIDPRPEERERAVQDHIEALELAGRVGALGVISPPIISMKMQPDRPRIPDLRPVLSRDEIERRMVIELYRRIARRGEEVGAAIIVEPLNRYEQWWPCTLQDGVDICESVGSPACRMMADLFHMNIEEADLPAAIRRAGRDYIFNVHLADSHRRLPGSGHTDFAACFRALKEMGYDRYCGLECRVDGEPMEALSKNVEYLRGLWAKA